jgi:hypothetical protein
MVATQAAHEQQRLSAEAAAEAHRQKAKELESSHVDKPNELSEEIRRIAVELRVRDLARNSVAIHPLIEIYRTRGGFVNPTSRSGRQ